jgi:dTDP-4-dehydrorhamnose reductase
MDTLRWLITGANGLLGYRVGEQAARRGEAFGMVRAPDRRVADGVAPVLADLANLSALRAIILMVRPQYVIHLAAMTKVADCESDPDTSLALNVSASQELAKASHELGAQFVFASTDMVFDGDRGPYAESSEARPLNVYGKHKLMAEKAIFDVCPTALVCRLPWMFGVPTPQYDGHFGAMVRSLLAEESVTLFEDEFRTPLGTDQVAKLLLDLSTGSLDVGSDAAGENASVPRTIHFAGPLSTSRYEIGCWAAEALNLSTDLIVCAKRAAWQSTAQRPANSSLVTDHPECLADLPERDIKADVVAYAQRIKHEIDCPNPHDHSPSVLEGHTHDPAAHDHGH